jgi:hypothetical protein
MMVRWFVTAGLVAIPLLAAAECGWVLMLPKVVGPNEQMGPLSSWYQEKAFDSARECEEFRHAGSSFFEKKLGEPLLRTPSTVLSAGATGSSR